MSVNHSSYIPIGKVQQMATRIIFFIGGLATGAWAPLVPFAKKRLELNEGQLGVLLLCLGVGSILAMPLAGSLAGRYGCRRMLIVATIVMGLSLPLLATLSSLPLLVVTLFVFGAGIGSLGCVISIQALIVERASGRTLMSGFHGLYSVGGVLGAGGVSALLSQGASPLLAIVCVVLLLGGAIGYATSGLLPYGSQADESIADESTGSSSPVVIPHGIVLFISILCFIVFLTEGSILDWSAVFLTKERGIDPSRAGLGYTFFSLTMMVGRFTGDSMIQRIGSTKMVIGGSLCAATGLLVATLLPHWQAGLAGYALVGLGCSNSVPVLFSAVGRQQIMPEHLAIPAVSTIAYTGILAGPALIGLIAQLTSLSTAFLWIVVLLLGVAMGARKIP